jgi:RNA polymerase primary sigma factor
MSFESVKRAELIRNDTTNATLLTRYFRDMGAHQVMSPDEEVQCAQELEQAEVHHWVTLLAFLPIAELILARLIQDANGCTEAARPEMPQLGALQELIVSYRSQHSKLRVAQRRSWYELSRLLACQIRQFDHERQWVARAIELAEHGGPIQPDHEGLVTIAKTPAYMAYIACVQKADVRCREARNRFVRANLRLVVSIALRHNRGRLALEDLVQEGNLGLMKAVNRFDWERGFRFSTYANWWIRHHISRALADKGRAVRVPVHMLEIIHVVAAASSRILARTGREPTLEELTADTGISNSRLLQARACATAATLSLDSPFGEDDKRRPVDLLTDKEALSPFDGMVKRNWLKESRRLLENLTPIEKRIIQWRFGLDNDDELTLNEIGAKYGLSRERIRQLQEQALHKMRKQTNDDWR